MVARMTHHLLQPRAKFRNLPGQLDKVGLPPATGAVSKMLIVHCGVAQRNGTIVLFWFAGEGHITGRGMK